MASSLFTSGFAFAALCAGCAVAGDSAKIAPVLNQPKLVVGEVGPLISGTDPFPIPPEHAGVCEQVAELANATRAKSELFYAISEPYREIVPPEWEPLDYRGHKELIVEGLYDGVCDEPYLTNPNSGQPFSETERAECRERRRQNALSLLRGEPRLEHADIDIDRDGDPETVYQLFQDPEIVSAELATRQWLAALMPKFLVSPTDDPEALQRLRNTFTVQIASLAFWRDNLYTLRGWGSRDEYQVDLLMLAQGELGKLPICKLQPEGIGDDKRPGAGGR